MPSTDLKIGVYHVRGVPVFIAPVQIGENAMRVFGATLVKEQAVWLFPAFRPFMDDVLHDFAIALPDAKFSEAALEHIEKQRVISGVRPDFTYLTKPFAHQEEAVQFLLPNLRAGLFYDPGLGKTKAIIDVLRHEKQKTLVLAPVTALKVWVREVAVHSKGELTTKLFVGGSKKKRLEELKTANESDILLVSYDSAPRYLADIIAAFDYRIIVADESHYLRDIRSNRTKAALHLADRAARRILASGTPTLGNPMHLYGQLSFLGKYVPAKNFRSFQKYYLIRTPLKSKKNVDVIVGYKNLDMLNYKLQRLSIRKTADECLDLPQRTIIDVEFDVSAEQKRVYNAILDGEVMPLLGGNIAESPHAAVTIQKLLQVLSGFYIEPPPPICDDGEGNACRYLRTCAEKRIKPYTTLCQVAQQLPARSTLRFPVNGKLEAFADTMRDLMADESHKVIVWAHFIEELSIIEELFKAEEWSYVRIDGSNSSRAVDLSVGFNNEPNPRIWLGQISTGVSITLNRAAYMVYYGVNFSLDHYLQSLDRNHRIGQEKPTFTYRLTRKGSLLDFVWRALSAKIDLARTVTTRINCAFCPKSFECIACDIAPFTEKCVHKSQMSRVIARPQRLV